ncbi:hypothetical protein [Deinococcus roseus]|uniref:hypothetical protein n=1 Tax=Deinococcus roseus TaxID=392414 RepID=UPI00166B9D81|nr:hypothetical protein [Deinococcus roseus]
MEWARSAFAGADFAAQNLVDRGMIHGCRVCVKVIEGHVFHTNTEDFWCAAAMAVFKAFLPEDKLPAYRWENNLWHFVFPDQTWNQGFTSPARKL